MNAKNGLNARRGAVLLVGAGAIAFGSLAGGCNNAGEGALSGATLGALAGMGIGSLYGDMGKGAALGAIAGGVGGAVLGDQNERQGRSGGVNEW